MAFICSQCLHQDILSYTEAIWYRDKTFAPESKFDIWQNDVFVTRQQGKSQEKKNLNIKQR